MTTAHEIRRPIIRHAAEGLAREANEAARNSLANSPAWRFYHGVETAAMHVIHPEMARVRDGTSWLDREAASFRDGFMEASTLLAMAAIATQPPMRIRLPHIDESVGPTP